MFEPLDEEYFVWLYGQVANPNARNRRRLYFNLFRQMYSTECIWLVPNDDARLQDGKDLRHEFILLNAIEDVDSRWLNLECSFLEMLIALARRIAFETDGNVDTCFWLMLGNIELHECSDAYEYNPEAVAEVIDRVIWRQYDPNGFGGLFPLQRPDKDQTKVELWYQLAAYILENE
jgi:hypothetical protein